MNNFHRNNHYVPQNYLKRWSSDGLKIWSYCILVNDQKVPFWKLHSIRGVAFHAHLYTRISAGSETDEFECWFEKEFETPVQEALDKVTSDRHLTPNDWERLIRFAAAQNVRTPSKLSISMERWRTEMPELLNNTLQKAVQDLGEANRTGNLPKNNNIKNTDIFPLRVTREPLPNTDKSLLKVETIIGRSMWLYGIKHILTNTVKVLLQHKWCILHAAPGIEWATSDDPVICLNYYENRSYDFGGGWGNKGSEIIFPLSPHHILYTKIGHRSPYCKEVTYELSTLFQRMIVEHAHRWIFAKNPSQEIEVLRPRKIDAIACNNEMEAWKNWHDEQSSAEKEYE